MALHQSTHDCYEPKTDKTWAAKHLTGTVRASTLSSWRYRVANSNHSPGIEEQSGIILMVCCTPWNNNNGRHLQCHQLTCADGRALYSQEWPSRWRRFPPCQRHLTAPTLTTSVPPSFFFLLFVNSRASIFYVIETPWFGSSSSPFFFHSHLRELIFGIS